jgi:hypothetical protein
MKAFGELLDKRSLEKAKAIVSRALDDPYTKRINPWELVQDANKHLGSPPQPARPRSVSVQRGTPEGVDVAQYGQAGAAALLGGAE